MGSVRPSCRSLSGIRRGGGHGRSLLPPHAPDGRRNKNKGHGSAAVALEGAEGGLRVLVRHQ
ncbi:hypothetical protein EASAB2608_04484 [Streptomyces sp. EAS-AB2608]|nr:hypothetical protein EASAB2608_04484 [Streptomyces sp. EAS-AB2608]